MKKKKNASFSYKFLSMLVDLFFILIIIIPLSLIAIDDNGKVYTINSTYYYVWFALFIIFQSIFYLVIPALTKGKTLGMLIFQLELESTTNESIYITILKRNYLTTFLWMLLLVSFICFVPANTAQKLLTSNNLVKDNKAVFSTWELAGISVPALFSPIILMSNLFNAISTSINANSVSIFEKIYNFRIVHKNKTVETIEDLTKKLKPIEYKKYELIWKDKKWV